MAGTPQPVGKNGPLPAFWNATFQAINQNTQQNVAQMSGRNQGIVVDQYGNALEIYGSNLDQVVTLGAAFTIPGVLIWTGFGPGSAGRAVINVFVTGTITLTKGSTAATASTSSFGNGLPIGAADVTDPTTGFATPAITPGTTVASGGGTTSLVLSQAAAESGTGLLCIQASWSLLS